MARFYIKPLRESFGLGDRKVLEVRNGTPPFNWSVTGNDFTLDESITTERTNFITSSLTAVTDVYAEITVTDADGNEVSCPCIICVLTVCCDDPNYFFRFNNQNNNIVFRGSSRRVVVLGGCPPYHWIVSGEGFSFKYEYTNSRFNYILYSGTDHSVGMITVTDNCGNDAERDLEAYNTINVGGVVAGIDKKDEYELGDKCTDEDYKFHFQSEADIILDNKECKVIRYIGGYGFVLLHNSNPIDFSFNNIDAGEGLFAGPANGGEVLICGASNKGGTGLGGVRGTDGCLNSPAWPVGFGRINLKLIGCCDNLPDGVFELNTVDTSETIVKNNSAIIVVEGGCSPFTFTTNSFGYSFAGGVTTYENEYRYAVVYCVDGICGTNFAAVCNVVVTDRCGNTINVAIRNAESGWQFYMAYQAWDPSIPPPEGIQLSNYAYRGTLRYCLQISYYGFYNTNFTYAPGCAHAPEAPENNCYYDSITGAVYPSGYFFWDNLDIIYECLAGTPWENFECCHISTYGPDGDCCIMAAGCTLVDRGDVYDSKFHSPDGWVSGAMWALVVPRIIVERWLC